MKRYDIGTCWGSPAMEETPAGDYVKAEDALALERKVAELERERDQLQRQLHFAVLLINRRHDCARPVQVVTDLQGNTRELFDPAGASC